MRKFFSSVVVVVSLLAVMGCSNGSNENIIVTKEIDLSSLSNEEQTAMNKFGNVTKVYVNDNAGNSNGAEITNPVTFNKVSVQNYLVEFEANENNNSVMNYINEIGGNERNFAYQMQGEYNIVFDPNKQYVEFTTYRRIGDSNNRSLIDSNKGEIDGFKTRTFPGNYDKTKNYAVQVNFNKDMNKDAYRYINIENGYKTVKVNDVDMQKMLTEYEFIKQVGIPLEIYKKEGSYQDLFLVKYDTLNDGVEKGLLDWRKPDYTFVNSYDQSDVNIDFNNGFFVEFRYVDKKKGTNYESKFWQLRYFSPTNTETALNNVSFTTHHPINDKIDGKENTNYNVKGQFIYLPTYQK